MKCTCKALADRCTAVARDHKDPRLITPEQMASDVLPWLPVIKAWAAAMEDYTLQQALEGVSYEGYKLVEGRSVRKITDPAAVMGLLAKEGYAPDEYMKPATLCGLTDLEKLVGKKRLATLCAPYIAKPQGKPTLVSADDKRPVFNAAADDFKNINI